ncbi:MAG: hypothetical protein V4671_09505, partial [Armatimonadota bacterium]
DEMRKWWQFLDANSISWCNWSVADKDEASAALKPGANERGGWPDSAISASGKFVREELRKKNPRPVGKRTATSAVRPSPVIKKK